MKTFILIHGSWHSSWNWHRVIPILEKQGHKVIAIDLPGMGRDKTPIDEVRMESTVQKICGLIDSVEGKVILVGHSKNGIMISQAAEYRPDKIEKLVYLAAYLIPNGKTQKEYSMQDAEGVLKPYVTMYEELNAHTLRPEIYKEGLYADCDDGITELAKLLLSHEPVESATTPLRLTEGNYGRGQDFILNAPRIKQSLHSFNERCTPKCLAKRSILYRRAILLFLAGRRNCRTFSVKSRPNMYHHIELERGRLKALIHAGEIKFGGNKKLKIYGALTCQSGKRMKGESRVFFRSEAEAVSNGYRPCGHCMTIPYRRWKKRGLMV